MGTTTNFDVTQTAYLFNWISNSSCLEAGTPQQLADFTYCALLGPDAAHPTPFEGIKLPGLLPTLGSQLWGGAGAGWQLVWGPGVFEIDEKSGRADNTAFVVYSAAIDTYVVAIAGTDPSAFWDWMKEDFRVGVDECVNWTTFSPTAAQAPTGGLADPLKPQISVGTAYGVWALASQLTQSQWSPAPGQTLAAFLGGLKATAGQTQVIFTGHSLGGALSPTLANWARGLANLKDAAIYAVPTAGPTPGNKCYQSGASNAAAWDLVFPETPSDKILNGQEPNSGNAVTSLNCDVWCTEDVVPHAWQYIYTILPELRTPVADQHYFNGVAPVVLGTQIGVIADGAVLRPIASSRQAAGDAASMWRSAHTTPFSLPTDPNWKMQYYDKDQLTSMPAPKGPYFDDLTFLKNLGLIHVWAYGTVAFGIDFSVFEAIHATPLATATK